MVANVADNSDLDIDDEELERHYAVQMRLLDEAHAYARTPTRRRKIEAAQKKLRAEIEDIRAKSSALDVSYRAWVQHLDEVVESFRKDDEGRRT